MSVFKPRTRDEAEALDPDLPLPARVPRAPRLRYQFPVVRGAGDWALTVLQSWQGCRWWVGYIDDDPEADRDAVAPSGVPPIDTGPSPEIDALLRAWFVGDGSPLVLADAIEERGESDAGSWLLRLLRGDQDWEDATRPPVIREIEKAADDMRNSGRTSLRLLVASDVWEQVRRKNQSTARDRLTVGDMGMTVVDLPPGNWLIVDLDQLDDPGRRISAVEQAMGVMRLTLDQTAALAGAIESLAFGWSAGGVPGEGDTYSMREGPALVPRRFEMPATDPVTEDDLRARDFLPVAEFARLTDPSPRPGDPTSVSSGRRTRGAARIEVRGVRPDEVATAVAREADRVGREGYSTEQFALVGPAGPFDDLLRHVGSLAPLPVPARVYGFRVVYDNRLPSDALYLVPANRVSPEAP